MFGKNHILTDLLLNNPKIYRLIVNKNNLHFIVFPDLFHIKSIKLFSGVSCMRFLEEYTTRKRQKLWCSLSLNKPIFQNSKIEYE